MRTSYLFILLFSFHTAAAQVNFVKDFSSIRTIAQLTRPFAGKPLFVDLWATWCEPCIDEFRYSKALYQFCQTNGIVLLYISFDKNGEDGKWRDLITQYGLSGYHLRAGKPLQDDLTMSIWNAKDAYSIPHYLFFDKNGTLIDKSAPQPDTGDSLFAYLKGKISGK